MNISTPQASFLSNIGRFPSSYIGSANDGMGLGGILPALVNIMVLGKKLMSPVWPDLGQTESANTEYALGIVLRMAS